LSKISNRNAYKKEELEKILNFLVDRGFLIIPLIQTYGHLEYVLKLNEFKHLRELEQHFQVITPCLGRLYEKAYPIY
jgi:hexosaminidase